MAPLRAALQRRPALAADAPVTPVPALLEALTTVADGLVVPLRSSARTAGRAEVLRLVDRAVTATDVQAGLLATAGTAPGS